LNEFSKETVVNESETKSMNREWDVAVAGVALDPSGTSHMMYDFDELVKLHADRGIDPTLASENIQRFFAAARNWPSAPLLFQRMTPAEARAASMNQDRGHENV
tara:strand:- start:1857 stop:2168 length:312 start_codon:yes stop_codon:yes gene_type:complete